MSRPPAASRRLLSRAAILLAALLATAVATPTTAQAASEPTEQRQGFYADSGDRCVYGQVTGVLAWRVTRPPAPAPVDLAGILTDRPTVNDTRLCQDDGWYSVASFTAYAGERVVDREDRRADNSNQEFTLTLSLDVTGALAQIDRVVIQVCRHPLPGSPLPAFYCGPARTYYPIGIGPA